MPTRAECPEKIAFKASGQHGGANPVRYASGGQAENASLRCRHVGPDPAQGADGLRSYEHGPRAFLIRLATAHVHAARPVAGI